MCIQIHIYCKLCSNNFFFQLAVDFLFCLVLIEVLKQVSAWLKDDER